MTNLVEMAKRALAEMASAGAQGGTGMETQAGDELELLARIEDSAIRDEVLAFRDALGGKLTLLPAGSKFKPTSEEQWRKGAARKVFAEHGKLQAARYAGLSLVQKEEIARQTEREEVGGIKIPGRAGNTAEVRTQA
jgi:hypothetical protein